MSNGNRDAVLDVLIALNTILALIARANEMAVELMAVFEKARSEGRDLTDAELDEFRRKSVEARDLLTG